MLIFSIPALPDVEPKSVSFEVVFGGLGKNPLSKKRTRKQTKPSKATVITDPTYLSTLKSSIAKSTPKSTKSKTRCKSKNDTAPIQSASTPSTSGIRSSKRKRSDKINRDDPSNICSLCKGNYYDDDSDDKEGWIQCPECKDWLHETCAGVYGKEKFDFICDVCAD